MLHAFLCLLGLAVALPHEGVHERIAEATRRIERSPRDAELYLERAELHRQHRSFSESLTDLDHAARLESGLVEIDLLRGRSLAGLSRLEQAREALDRYLEARPADVIGLLARADVRERGGDLAGAERDLTAVIGLEPKPRPETYLSRSRVVRARGTHAATEEALTGIGQGLERLGPVTTLLLEAIDLEVDLGAHDLALARIEGVRERSLRRETWTARRGDVQALAGRTAAARASWRLALQEIASLPARHRRTRAVRALESELRARLALERKEQLEQR